MLKIEWDQYKLEVSFKIPKNLSSSFKSIELEIYKKNPKFEKINFYFRFASILLSLISGVFYISFYFKTKPNFRSFEHKYIFFLSVFLIISNDPLYIFNIIPPSIEFMLFINLKIFFYLLIIIFILTMLDRIHKESRQVDTTYL